MSEEFLTALAQPRPDPGGGAAAAFGARVALALLLKVVHLEHRRPAAGQEGREPGERRLQEAKALAESLRHLQTADVRAYERLSRARNGDGDDLPAAVLEATDTPRRIAAVAAQALVLVAEAGRSCRPHLVADLQVAAQILAGAGRGAGAIARANLPWLAESAQRQAWRRRLQEVMARLEDQAAETEAVLRARLKGSEP